MPRRIVIEKGSRIQYCKVAEVIRRDDTHTTYKYIDSEETKQVSNKYFNKWFWDIENVILKNKISIERVRLKTELDYLDFIEKICQEK